MSVNHDEHKTIARRYISTMKKTAPAPKKSAKAAKPAAAKPSKAAPPATLDDLLPDPDNPREITAPRRAALGTSLDEHGDLGGIVFNVRTRQLVSGHQRVDRLQMANGSLRLLEVEMPAAGKDGHAHVVDGNGHRFPVRLVDWDAARQRSANISANNPNAGGAFTHALQGQLAALREQDAALFAGLGMDALVIPQAEAGAAGAGEGRPVSFKAFDENLKTEHECPKCGYRWSGSTAPRGEAGADA